MALSIGRCVTSVGMFKVLKTKGFKSLISVIEVYEESESSQAYGK